MDAAGRACSILASTVAHEQPRESYRETYRSTERALDYRADHASKAHRRWSTRRELRILHRLLRGLRCDTALDLPCGYGRLHASLMEHARTLITADASEAMLRLSAADHGRSGGLLCCSALCIPLATRSIDLVVSIRLNHHFESDENRELHLRELMRVADRAVLFSYFSFDSLKNRLRRLRRPFDQKPPKLAMRPARVRVLAQEAGFEVRAQIPLSRLGSGHVFVRLDRR